MQILRRLEKFSLKNKTISGFVIIALLLIISYATAGTYGKPEEAITPVDTLHFVSNLNNFLDWGLNPCDNFYDFVCHRMLVNSTSSKVDYDLQVQRQQDYEELASLRLYVGGQDKLDVENKLMFFYSSCLEGREWKKLSESQLYRSLGGWPQIDPTSSLLSQRLNSSWLQIFSVLHGAGIRCIFNSQIEITSNQRVLILADVYPEPQIDLDRYEELARLQLKYFNVTSEPLVRQIVSKFLKLERQLRSIAKEKGGNVDKEVSFMEFKQMPIFNRPSSIYLAIDWDSYFRYLVGKSLQPNDRVNLTNFSKLEKYFQLLQNTELDEFLNWFWLSYLIEARNGTTNCVRMSEMYFPDVFYHFLESLCRGDDMNLMYEHLSDAYDELIAESFWPNKMSKRYSTKFLRRMIEVTVNADYQLNKDYEYLEMFEDNFYKNLENLQNFYKTILRFGGFNDFDRYNVMLNTRKFQKVITKAKLLLPFKRRLHPPLNYLLVGEQFSKKMIAGLSADNWRRTASNVEFNRFSQCLLEQQEREHKAATNLTAININNLVLKILANRQSWLALEKWQEEHNDTAQQIASRLSSGPRQLTLRQLHFIATTLVECQLDGEGKQREFLHAFLRNTPEFSEAFKCASDRLLAGPNKCILSSLDTGRPRTFQ